MGLFFWEWKFYIAPAPIVEKLNPYSENERLFRHWGMYVTKKVFKGLKHPAAGDVVSIPNYGPCKVERVIYWSKIPSKSFAIAIVVSPESLGNSEWWLTHRNNPVAEHGKDWTFQLDLPKTYFTDLQITPNGPLP